MIPQSELRFDLHMHSSYSDAYWSYAQLISEAMNNGVDIVSITDHDIISDMDFIMSIDSTLSFITGVEATVNLNGKLFHILGYGFDWQDAPLNELMNNSVRVAYNKTAQKDEIMIQALIDTGFPIDMKEYENSSFGPQPIPGRQYDSKVASYFLHKKLCDSTEDFYVRYNLKGISVKSPPFPHPSEVIGAIKKAGGVPVLAHPVHTSDDLPLDVTLKLFKDLSIEGIECYRPGYDQSLTELLSGYCRGYGLLVVGGSDIHGGKDKGRTLGIPEITYDQLVLGDLINKTYRGINKENPRGTS